jgi:hypothetical protein
MLRALGSTCIALSMAVFLAAPAWAATAWYEIRWTADLSTDSFLTDPLVGCGTMSGTLGDFEVTLGTMTSFSDLPSVHASMTQLVDCGDSTTPTVAARSWLMHSEPGYGLFDVVVTAGATIADPVAVDLVATVFAIDGLSSRYFESTNPVPCALDLSLQPHWCVAAFGDVTIPDFFGIDAVSLQFMDSTDTPFARSIGLIEWVTELSPDSDGDGVQDPADTCPFDAANDVDGDGVCGDVDTCPLDPANDADGDGVCGDVDTCPLDPDNDADSDGVCGDVDACPADAGNDADGDGVCGNVDECPGGDDTIDADGDGTPDACDTCPLDAANDADGDGVCAPDDACPLDPDNDADGDGVCGDVDACPLDPDNDADGDGICGDVDLCPLDSANDGDGDGVCETHDNCDLTPNADQLDNDVDSEGDLCDPDDDNDGVGDAGDNCPFDANGDQADADGDGVGDVCDDSTVGDSDGDGVLDGSDRCSGTAAGVAVDAEGCSIAQLCPCEVPWKNHGAFVSCTAETSEDFVEAGLITTATKNAIVRRAARSACGVKP